MREIRDPGTPIPDVVPAELVAVYGDGARRTVRRRRSMRFRLGRVVRRALHVHDVWFVTASVLLWGIVAASIGASATLAFLRWPKMALYAFVPLALVSAAFSAGYLVGTRRHHLG
jgi:hypothetical protein